jgi:hypothetical protein
MLHEEISLREELGMKLCDSQDFIELTKIQKEREIFVQAQYGLQNVTYLDNGNEPEAWKAAFAKREEIKNRPEKIDLPALIERLNKEYEDNPHIIKWLDDNKIKYKGYTHLHEEEKNVNILRIGFENHDEALFYDALECKFLSGKTEDILNVKREEFKKYMDRSESLADRLNEKLSVFDKDNGSDVYDTGIDSLMDTNRQTYVVDLLTEADKETNGGGISTLSIPDQGVSIAYIDKSSLYAPTILYDGNENKFLVDNLYNLMESQKFRYEHEQIKPAPSVMETPYIGQKAVFHLSGSDSAMTGYVTEIGEKSVVLQVEGKHFSFSRSKGNIDIFPLGAERRECEKTNDLGRIPAHDVDLER